MGIWRGTFIDRQIDERERTAIHISGEGNVILDEIDLLDHSRHLIAAKKIAEKAKDELVGLAK